MKGNIRKIVVNGLPFIYRVSDKFHPENSLNTLTVKVFLSGEKRTSLTIRFLTLDGFRCGQPLTKNIQLFHQPTNEQEAVNLNEPGYIRKLIELAFEKGWNGSKQLEFTDGLNWLRELGYDVSELETEVERVLKKDELTGFDFK